MEFQMAGIAALIFFYGIYFGKMLRQKAKGIKTDQIAKGDKKGRLFWTEFFMKIATFLVVVAESVSVMGNWSCLPKELRWGGMVLAFIGILIFGLSVYTMQDSWRAGIPEEDKTEFVTRGIYSVSRNPAFLGFDLTYLGILIMFFNPLLFVFSCFAGIMLHLQILQEEFYLEEVFGAKYQTYKKRVRRYL